MSIAHPGVFTNIVLKEDTRIDSIGFVNTAGEPHAAVTIDGLLQIIGVGLDGIMQMRNVSAALHNAIDAAMTDWHAAKAKAADDAVAVAE